MQAVPPTENDVVQVRHLGIGMCHAVSIDDINGQILDELQTGDEMDRLGDHTQELKQRITTLKELITTMVTEEKETKRQSELLLEMLELLKALKKLEVEALNAFTAYDNYSHVKPTQK